MRVIISLLFAFALTACAGGTFDTNQAKRDMVLVQRLHGEALRAELIYLKQVPCGLAGSPMPPLCASYAVGLQIQAYNKKADDAVAKAQDALNNLGANPSGWQVALEAAKAVIAEWNALIPRNAS